MLQLVKIGLVSVVLISVILVSNTYFMNAGAQERKSTNGTSIAAVGDWGCGPDATATVKSIESVGPNVTFLLGDLSYEGGDVILNDCSSTDKWFDTIRPIEKNSKLVIGNHDTTVCAGWGVCTELLSKYKEHFCNPLAEAAVPGSTPCINLYYSFDDHNIHFLVMNSEEEFGKDSAQYRFVVKDLEKASLDPKIKWIIVLYHRSIYAAVQWLGEILPPPMDKGKYITLKNNFLNIYHPLLEKYQVDLVLQGHVHNYQRTYPLKINPDTNGPMRTSTESNTYVNPEGEIYVSVGTGGVGLDPVPTDDWSLHSISPDPEDTIIYADLNDLFYFPKIIDDKYGFLNLVLSKNQSSINGTFYANNSPNSPLALDHFTLSKH